MMASGVEVKRPTMAKDVFEDRMVRLRCSIIAYSVSPDPTIDFAPCDSELVLYVPPAVPGGLNNQDYSLQRTFEFAHKNFSGQSQRIRIVADGATARPAWPGWVHKARNLVLTEAGAYRIEDSVTATRPIAGAVRDWLDNLFEGVVGNVRPSDLFFSSACSRFFQPAFAETTMLPFLLQAHRESNVVIVGANKKRSRRDAESLRWKYRLGATLTLYLGKAMAGQIRNFVRNAPARRELATNRSSRRRPPDVWMALIPHWRRINRHVIESVVPAAERSGRKVGILWAVSMEPGELGDRGTGKIAGKHLWPALDDIKLSRGDLEIEQLVGPDTFPKLINLLCAGFAASLRVGYRLIRTGPVVGDYGSELTLSWNLPGLAALATSDLLQAIGIERAFKEVKSRRNFGGIPVVFASLSHVDTATAEALLRREGAITIDFKHGSGGDGWFGQTETFPSYAATWTATDSINCERQGLASIVVRDGIRSVFDERPETIRNVLILSNYVHRDWRSSDFPHEPFQRELLSFAQHAEQQFPGKFVFGWRPHPDDVDELVNPEVAKNRALKMWRDGSLSESLAWADLVIVSPSSTMIQALQAGVPVMVHAPPSVNLRPEIHAVAEERRFFYALEGVRKLDRIAQQFENCGFEALQADRELVQKLWQPHRIPSPNSIEEWVRMSFEAAELQ